MDKLVATVFNQPPTVVLFRNSLLRQRPGAEPQDQECIDNFERGVIFNSYPTALPFSLLPAFIRRFEIEIDNVAIHVNRLGFNHRTQEPPEKLQIFFF